MPDATRVTATLAFRRNPDARRPRTARAPLVLDGEQQDAVRGRARRRARWRAAAACSDGDARRCSTRPRRARSPSARASRPSRNAALEGLYVSSGVFCTQCEPEGFRRITYFPDRPDVLARYTRHAARRSRALPGAAVQRQPGRAGRAARRPPLRDLARPVSQALLPVRAGRGRPGRARGRLRHAVGAQGGAAHLLDAAPTCRAAATRWSRSSARCAGTRSASAASTTSTPS